MVVIHKDAYGELHDAVPDINVLPGRYPNSKGLSPRLVSKARFSWNAQPMFADCAEGRMTLRGYRMWWNRVISTFQGGAYYPFEFYEETRRCWMVREQDLMGSVNHVDGVMPSELFTLVPD